MEASASDVSATASAERLRLRAEARQRRLLAAEAARRMHVVTGTPVQWKTPTTNTDLREGVREATVVLEQNSLNVVDSSGGPQNSGDGGPSVADPDGRELPGNNRDSRCQWGQPADKTFSAVNSRELFSQCKQAETNRGPTELIGMSESSTGKTVRARVNQVVVAGAPSDGPAGSKTEITNLVSSMPVYVADATAAAAGGQSSCSGGFTASSVSQVVGTSVEGSFPHAQQHGRLSGKLKKQDICSGLSGTEQRKVSVLHWLFPFVLFSALASRCVKWLVRWQNHLQSLRWLQLLLHFVIATAWASFPPPTSSVGPSSLSSVSEQSGGDKTEGAAWTSEVLPSRRSFRSALPEKLQEWVPFVVWQPLLWVVVSSVVLLLAEHSRELDTWLDRRRQAQDKQERRIHGRKSMQWEESEEAAGNSDELLGRAMVWLSRVLLVMKLGFALLEVLRQVAVFAAMYCCIRYGLTWFATVLECPSGLNSSFHDRP